MDATSDTKSHSLSHSLQLRKIYLNKIISGSDFIFYFFKSDEDVPEVQCENDPN